MCEDLKNKVTGHCRGVGHYLSESRCCRQLKSQRYKRTYYCHNITILPHRSEKKNKKENGILGLLGISSGNYLS
jgi:hypothetical protein